ncbi:MAG: N-6 DNA methylase [Lachnospiraceae bacterium]|nr:N-6 DNA methylase [Lachnospiraceae bacterium]
MQLQSVKETAKRFHISERRVQKLCETGRIKGARMVSNVWLIPDTAAKPTDERTVIYDKDLLSLSDLCRELSISTATGRNWLKLGKLMPSSEIKKTPFFTKEYAIQMKADIANGKNAALKSRRNKKYVSGNTLYHSYVSDTSSNLSAVQAVLDCIEEKNIEITDEILCMLIAECAVQLKLNKNHDKTSSDCLSGYLHGTLKSKSLPLIDDLISPYPQIDKTVSLYTDLLNIKYQYEEGEDLLGLLYISLKNIGNRKATGSYYTPTAVVQKLCRRLFSMNEASGKDVFDPCCGTGNFLLQLPPQIGFEHVYGNDMDPVSVKIARINLSLKYDISDPSVTYLHITESDYLSSDPARQFDFIIGNPPWGYDFTAPQKTQLRSRFKSATGSSIESYDVFVERALSDLKEGGILSFVLPEAILNVKTHTPIRQIMLNCCFFQYLEFLGNPFDQVQCPCIILQTVCSGTAFRSQGMLVFDGTREYSIQGERKVSADCFSFSTTDEEYRILEKMDNLQGKVTLCGNADFALGIVTGNNKEYISQIKNKENEIILKGSDLRKFRFTPSENYIVFKPESFQQVAPVEYYRAPEKLLYRFICSQLVFAYDNRQTLSLNSCNILIPKIHGLSIKYILAVLNSRTVQFYFRKQFNSVKVLRAHLERLPIAFTDTDSQNQVVNMVDGILETSDKTTVTDLYNELDRKIADLYGLTPEEYRIVKSTMEDENLFLY